MLYGLAAENLIKAIIVAKNPSLASTRIPKLEFDFALLIEV
jgi:hypothetical protein